MHDFSGPRYSQSLARGLAILECFRAERSLLGIAEIAEELGMSRPTAHRYLTTLVALGYMEQDKSRKYRLSLRVTDLGMSALNATGLRELARPVLEELRLGSGFTAGLAVLDGPDIIYVDRAISFQQRQYDIDVGMGIGSRLPAYCTAPGKALLAQLSAEDLRERLAGTGPRRMGPRTSQTALAAELERVLEKGYASEDEELEQGRIAIAAPVRGETGVTIAAIDLVSNTSVISAERLAGALRPHLITAAGDISKRLGYLRGDEIAMRK